MPAGCLADWQISDTTNIDWRRPAANLAAMAAI